MRARFYVSADGEVLSNAAHPVTKPLCIITEVKWSGQPVYVEAVSEIELRDARFKHKLYKAMWIELPEEMFKAVDGIIR